MESIESQLIDRVLLHTPLSRIVWLIRQVPDQSMVTLFDGTGSFKFRYLIDVYVTARIYKLI